MSLLKWNPATGVAVGLLLVGVAASAHADTLQGYVIPTAQHAQEGPALIGPANYLLRVGGEFTTQGDFTSGTVTYPGAGSPKNLTAGPYSLEYDSPYYSSLADMLVDYPYGTYSVSANGPAGSQTSDVSYEVDDNFTSDIPQVTNFDSLQDLDPAADFTFYFPAFTPNPSTDDGEAWTFFTLYDFATGAVVYYQPFLPTTTTSWTVPANTLLANTKYIFDVNYDNRILDASGSGAQVEYDRRTEGVFMTGTPVTGVPEPGSLGLLALGLLGLGCCRRWRPG